MLKPAVLDISHHNIVQSFVPAKKSGIVGVIHKLTEGTDYIDDKVAARYYLAQEADVKWGLYHFARPGDPIGQAEFFCEQAERLHVTDDNTLYVLDHEDTGFDVQDALDFMVRVEELTGRQPAIYSGHVLKEQLDDEPNDDITGYRLWLAQYGPEPELPEGFEELWLWQYTEDGTCPGINPPVDLNAYEGTAADLRRTWSGGGRVVPPQPEPEPEQAPAWLMVMRAITGLTEEPGSGDNPRILKMADVIAKAYPEMASYCAQYQHDSTAWCGLTAAFCMTVAGIRPPFGPTDTDKFLWALAWSDADDFEGPHLEEPRLGCVVVMEREGGGHVTFYERTEGDYYVCRGGNQGDMVNESKYAISTVVALVWPIAAIKPEPGPEPGTPVVTINIRAKGDVRVKVDAPEFTNMGNEH